MRVFIWLVVSLAGTVVLGAAAEASTQRVTIVGASASVVGSSWVMSGRLNGSADVVRIERYKAGRWVLASRVPVYQRTYKARLKAPSGRVKYRAGVAGRYSRTVTVTPIPVPTDACGPVLRKPDGAAWSCSFNDEFNGSVLDASKWTAQTAFATGTQAVHACYLDDPSTIRVADGYLDLTLRAVAAPVSCSFGSLTGPTNYVSGGVMTYRKFGQQFGRFEARIKTTATIYPGLKEAFWLWPDDRVASTEIWPDAGEIDISETYSKYPSRTVPFLHYSADSLGNLLGVNTAWDCLAQRGSWNTYTLEWSAAKVEIFVNGTSCLTNTSGDPAFAKPYIMALTQGLGFAGNEYDGRAPIPATMSVDYIRVWK